MQKLWPGLAYELDMLLLGSADILLYIYALVIHEAVLKTILM